MINYEWVSDNFNVSGKYGLKSTYPLCENEEIAIFAKLGKVKSTETPAVGSIVLVKEEYAPQAAWSLGRVTDLHYSSDDEVRSATVWLPNGKVLNRALTIESEPAADCKPREPVEPRNWKNPNESTPRPVRRTAQTSQDKLQEHIQAGNV